MRNKVHQPTHAFRLTIVFILGLAALVLLLWRAVDLQIMHKEFLQQKGDARYLRTLPVATHRGMITDRHGEPLAISTPVDSVWAQPKDFLAASKHWPQLARLLDIDLKRLRVQVIARQDKEFMYIKRRINPALAQQVMALELAGVFTQREYRRYYPMGEVAAHIIGFTNVDDTGQEGMELAYDDWLRSSPGLKRVIKDRLGYVIKDVELINAPRPGKDLVLSIDRRLQYLVYKELKRAVLEHQAMSGSAVILDAQTGEVLAMTNQPSYNPNNREDFKVSHYRNRAVTDVFEPGSTIKPFTVAAALESGRFRVNTTVDTSPGVLRLGGDAIRDTRNYGRIDVATVIKKSSNVGASKIALATPAKNLWQVFSRVGFGNGTGSGFPGESTGHLSRHSSWRKIEHATLAFGYGLSVTPLQLASAYTVLANQGRLVPVSFLAVEQNGKVREQQVLKSSTAKQLRSMLEAVVSPEGTGSLARVKGYRVAGKTGTVRKAGPNGYNEDRYLAVFVGMAPASHPRLVMMVTINEPASEKYYGGHVAAPVFSRVMAGALRLLDIPMDDLSTSRFNLASLGDEP